MVERHVGARFHARKSCQKAALEAHSQIQEFGKLRELANSQDPLKESELDNILTDKHRENVRERLSNVWTLQAKLTEGLANLALKLTPEVRSGEEFDTVVKIGNELKVLLSGVTP